VPLSLSRHFFLSLQCLVVLDSVLPSLGHVAFELSVYPVVRTVGHDSVPGLDGGRRSNTSHSEEPSHTK
jgi:hypothetical protein